ncbi:isovaleryl-CoA dehydrogenase [Massilia sp. W12]|uniref:isovaleryl-CoA dehydrogenase n=1 Tax=Massilia sp. W12 TaxID=3126507 RepID=UPI0030D370AD
MKPEPEAAAPQRFVTHRVHNVAPRAYVNLYDSDLALQSALAVFGVSLQDCAMLRERGQEWGAQEMQEHARLANQYGPRHLPYDSVGNRIDEIEFHPAWHALMRSLIASGAHAAPWDGGSHVTRGALYLLYGQLENGSQCPVTMTFASVAALQANPALARDWLPKILSREYDPRSLPAQQKNGVLLGMGMTEKQGGSDVRANSTRACASGVQDEWGMQYRIIGHKWFFSAPQCDAHLILAQSVDESGQEAGLSCYFVPRYLRNGQRNPILVQRLKDKLGNRSNASSEVEFQEAIGYPLGPSGRGVATIMEMGSLTRLDCVLGSAGILRAALSIAMQHAHMRQAFGKALAQQPLMQNVLADLALESEAATWFALRLAHCFDADDAAEKALARLLTAAGKYWLCKRGPAFGAEAMEVLGGNGYVEEGVLARLYRELPVNSIWEGSGNVICLDVLRVLAKGPAPQLALQQELKAAQGRNAQFDAYSKTLCEDLLQTPPAHIENQAQQEFGARELAMRIVLALQASLLLRHAPRFVAQAFIHSRLRDGGPAACFGGLDFDTDCAAIIARAWPAGAP